MRDIPNYEGRYAITEDGKVWSYYKKRFLSTGIDRDGYEVVRLYPVGGKEKCCKIHRLVAITYLLNPDNLPEVNHKDEVKTNNHVSNLEWCSHNYNSSFGTINDRRRQTMLDKKTGRPVYCVELDKVFSSAAVAARETGATQVGAAARGAQKTSGGYHWRYVE